MDVGSTELKILQVTQPYVDQGYSQLHLLEGLYLPEGVPLMTYISFLLLFCSFFPYICIKSVCRHVWLINITIFSVEALL